MNIAQLQLLSVINWNSRYLNQRELAKKTNYSLGKVNNLIRQLKLNKYLNFDNNITTQGYNYIKSHHPQKAVVLAAGYGIRMVPINTEEPKGLLEVNGSSLIERLIHQLHEVGIKDIIIIVGFMKERYEYLIDKYNVKLIVNTHYRERNNIYSLFLAKDQLINSYVIPCDVWFKYNPFSIVEDPSWYLFSDELVDNSNWLVTKTNKVRYSASQGNKMIGIAYLNKQSADIVKQRLIEQIKHKNFDAFWEDILEKGKKFLLNGKILPADQHQEINSYEELLDADSHSKQLNNEAITIIEKQLNINKKEIHQIHTLKKGMTNRSFIFTVNNKRYIMRIPGEGTDKLINRGEEYKVYQKIKDEPYTEKVLYLNPKNGYKLSKFIEDTHNSSSDSWQEVAKCMNLLRKFHQKNFKVRHDFKIWQQIDFYESLRKYPSVYKDYDQTKHNVLSLRTFIKQNIKKWCLCHIDANADNFLINKKGQTFLIDWEYAGMQDPDLDIAMYAIYAMYNREDFDKLIDLYYPEGCPKNIRYKIYAYAAVGGLLWSNWCEYKQSLGLDFDEYSIAQYRYAKEYSKLVLKYLEDRKNA